jgi:hypothetical protein
MKHSTTIGLAASALLAAVCGPADANVVTEWNALAMGCITRTGPATGLDLAVVHAAVHDAVQAIEGRYQPYLATPPANGDESKAAAAAAAAYRVLSDNRICPPPAAPAADTVQTTLDTAFAPYLKGDDPGLQVGYAAADMLLATEIRDTANTTITEPYLGDSTVAGQWRPTPPGNQAMTFVYVATKKPFVMSSAAQFRPGPPPPLTSERYLKDYNEVKQIGSTQSHPTDGACPAPHNTDMARFWAGNFAAQWNQVLRDAAIARQLGIGDTARLFALANLAAADSGIGVWDSKVHYNLWRPITAIREGDADTNPQTEGQADWTPFISSTHLNAQNPPYPDYVSGANGLTGAYTAMLQLYFQTDYMPLAIHKASPATVPICTTPRLYRKISDAAQEVVDARVLLGIHFRFADTAARTLGTRVAWHVFTHALRPVEHDWKSNHRDWDSDHRGGKSDERDGKH